MNRRQLLRTAIAIITIVIAHSWSVTTASAQCNNPACPGITVNVNAPCCVPITVVCDDGNSYDLNNGFYFCQASTEPCPCTSPTGDIIMVTLGPGGPSVGVGMGPQPILWGGDCCLMVNAYLDPNGCLVIDVTAGTGCMR